MNRRYGIVLELGLLLLFLALVPVGAAVYISNGIFHRSIRQETLARLDSIAARHVETLEVYVGNLITDVNAYSRIPYLAEAFRRIGQAYGAAGPDSAEYRREAARYEDFFQTLLRDKGYYDLLLIDDRGEVIYSVLKERDFGANVRAGELAQTSLPAAIGAANTLMETEVSDFAYYPPSARSAAFLAAPILDGGVIAGNLVLQVDSSALQRAVADLDGLGRSGEILTATWNKGSLKLTGPTRHDAHLHEQPMADARPFAPLVRALTGSEGTGEFADYRGVESVGAWRYLPSLNWSMLVKVDAAEVFASERRFQAISAGIMGGAALVALLGVWLAHRRVSRPIERLAGTVAGMAGSELPQRIELAAHHEVAALVAAFNTLIERVRHHQENLETQVRERTAELRSSNRDLEDANRCLSGANEELEQTLWELRRTQDQLVESEKLADLGQLVAGIAHEINTPLGAIASSACTLEASLAELLPQLPERLAALAPADRAAILALVRAAGDAGSNRSFRDKREAKKALEQQLAGRGVANGRRVADLLVGLGLTDAGEENCRQVLALPDSESLLELANRASHLVRAAQNIAIATGKATKVVMALKSFARFDRSGSKVPADLRAGLETVLTLYQNQIKHRVDLLVDYQPLPPVPCFPDELGQVWMNLIQNALQAMQFQGRLTVELRREDGWAVVRIGDSGDGIADAIRDKIFAPFFTTKPAGEGSGLGLDIVRKIVDKHAGDIGFSSVAGSGTVFTVRLPIEG